MSLRKVKRLTGHLPLLTALFALPIILSAVNKDSVRKPASISPKKNKYYHHKIDREKDQGHSHKSKQGKLSGKPNSHISSSVNVSVLNYRPETGKAEMLIRYEFSPGIDTDVVNVKWILPEDFEIVSGTLINNFQPMSAGDRQSLSLTVIGDPAAAKASFVQVSSIIGGTRLGDVKALALRQAMDSYFDAKNSDGKALKAASSEKDEPAKKYKIHF